MNYTAEQQQTCASCPKTTSFKHTEHSTARWCPCPHTRCPREPALRALRSSPGGRCPLLPSPGLSLSCRRPRGGQESPWAPRTPPLKQLLQNRQALLPHTTQKRRRQRQRGHESSILQGCHSGENSSTDGATCLSTQQPSPAQEWLSGPLSRHAGAMSDHSNEGRAESGRAESEAGVGLGHLKGHAVATSVQTPLCPPPAV